MMRVLVLIYFLALGQSTGLAFTQEQKTMTLTSMSKLQQFACDKKITNKDAWGVNNLYDCKSKTLYIPYQLWTGAGWNGDKTTPCMHHVENSFTVNGNSRTTITGPIEWANPQSGRAEQVWVRDKVDTIKTQYFTCHQKGIGRVFDSRKPRFYKTGRCKFPAGSGWKISIRGYCQNTSIQITDITFDQNGYLLDMKFKWWYKNWFRSKLDHIYRYKPNFGMQNAWKQ